MKSKFSSLDDDSLNTWKDLDSLASNLTSAYLEATPKASILRLQQQTSARLRSVVKVLRCPGNVPLLKTKLWLCGRQQKALVVLDKALRHKC